MRMHPGLSPILRRLRIWPLTFWPQGQCMPRSCHGLYISRLWCCRFPFRVRTNRQTDRRDWMPYPTSAAIQPTGVKSETSWKARRMQKQRVTYDRPVIEWTVSNATILGVETSVLASSCLKWPASLWRNRCFVTPLLQMPWIMDAWLPASENISHSSHTTSPRTWLPQSMSASATWGWLDNIIVLIIRPGWLIVYQNSIRKNGWPSECTSRTWRIDRETLLICTKPKSRQRLTYLDAVNLFFESVLANALDVIFGLVPFHKPYICNNDTVIVEFWCYIISTHDCEYWRLGPILHSRLTTEHFTDVY